MATSCHHAQVVCVNALWTTPADLPERLSSPPAACSPAPASVCFGGDLQFPSKEKQTSWGLRKPGMTWQGCCVKLFNVQTNVQTAEHFNPFTPKSDQFQIFPLQPHQKYYTTQYEELGFSSLTQMKDDDTTNSHYPTHTFLFRKLGECTFWTWEWKGKTLQPTADFLLTHFLHFKEIFNNFVLVYYVMLHNISIELN